MTDIDTSVIQRYEEDLDPSHPTRGTIPVTIIGYGEVSAVLKLEPCPGVVLKRMAGFETDAEVAQFRQVLHEYCDVIRERGVDVIPTESYPIDTARNGKVVYLVQPAIDAEYIGNSVLRTAPDDELRRLIRTILQRIQGVYTPNTDSATVHAALDAQISNWVWMPGDNGERRLMFIDVGAPFLRKDGCEQLSAEPFVRALPWPLSWYLRHYELHEIFERYYRLGGVLTDLAGNFIKEGSADRIELVLEEITAWAEGPAAHLSFRVPTRERVEKYYDNDARIWTWVLGARKLDRFVTTKILRRSYSHILPGKIQRR